jgi:hypothetical protein
MGGAAVGIGVSVGAARGVPALVGVPAATCPDRAVAVALMLRSSSSIEVLGAGVAAGRAGVSVPGNPVVVAATEAEGRPGVTGVTCWT